MAKSIFQEVYDWIGSLKTPRWLKDLLQQIQDLMIIILKQVTQAYIQYLQSKIIEASQHSEWSNKQKFGYVFEQAKLGFTEFAITLKDSEINVLIEFLVNKLKKNGVIT